MKTRTINAEMRQQLKVAISHSKGMHTKAIDGTFAGSAMVRAHELGSINDSVVAKVIEPHLAEFKRIKGAGFTEGTFANEMLILSDARVALAELKGGGARSLTRLTGPGIALAAGVLIGVAAAGITGVRARIE